MAAEADPIEVWMDAVSSKTLALGKSPHPDAVLEVVELLEHPPVYRSVLPTSIIRTMITSTSLVLRRIPDLPLDLSLRVEAIGSTDSRENLKSAFSHLSVVTGGIAANISQRLGSSMDDVDDEQLLEAQVASVLTEDEKSAIMRSVYAVLGISPETRGVVSVSLHPDAFQ